MARDIRFGSNCEILRRSIVIPSFPRQRTLILGWFSARLSKETVTLENYRRGRGVMLMLPLSTAFAAGAPNPVCVVLSGRGWFKSMIRVRGGGYDLSLGG
jgi:hypothetical protein